MCDNQDVRLFLQDRLCELRVISAEIDYYSKRFAMFETFEHGEYRDGFEGGVTEAIGAMSYLSGMVKKEIQKVESEILVYADISPVSPKQLELFA